MRMLEEFVDLEPDDMVIQNGANSAVGRAVIQFAHAQGCDHIAHLHVCRIDKAGRTPSRWSAFGAQA